MRRGSSFARRVSSHFGLDTVQRPEVVEQRLGKVELGKVSWVSTVPCSLLLVPRLVSAVRELNPSNKKLERCGNVRRVRIVHVQHIGV
jgi:hypothetical protein